MNVTQTGFDRHWNPFVLVWPDETPQQAVDRHYRQMNRKGFVILKMMPRLCGELRCELATVLR